MTNADVFRLVDLDGFQNVVDDLATREGNDQIVIGSLSEATRTYEPGDDVLRVADFVFPTEAFADIDTVTEGLDDSLLTSGFTQGEYVDESADVVHSPSEYKQLAREVADAYDDPAVLIGVFHAGRNFRMTGNPENEKPRRLSRMVFPERAFETDLGVEPLKSMSMTLQGAIIVEKAELSDAAREFVDDDRDELELADRNPDALDAGEVQELVANLASGDEVRFNDRSQPLTVVPATEAGRVSTTADVNVFLQGNGTDYRIAFDSEESARPVLDWESDRERITTFDLVSKEDTSRDPVEA